MKTISTPQSFEVSLGGDDYEIEVRPSLNSDDLDSWWISINKVQCHPFGYTSRPNYISALVTSDDCGPEPTVLDIVHAGIKYKVWGKVKGYARCCAEYRRLAQAEKGSKRGYYTRHANDCRRQLTEYAGQWKLAKAIWKELTKL